MKTVFKIILMLLIFSEVSLAGDWVLITNKENPVSSISAANLKRVYLGKMKNVDGTTIVPVMLADNIPVTGQFLQEVVGKTPEEYKNYWIEEQIKGQGGAPMIQKTSASAKLIVAGIPGAVTYIGKDEIDDTVKQIEIK